MKAGDLACYLTHNFAPVLLLRKGKKMFDEFAMGTGDTWVVILNGKEELVWSHYLVLWDNRKDEKVP